MQAGLVDYPAKPYISVLEKVKKSFENVQAVMSGNAMQTINDDDFSEIWKPFEHSAYILHFLFLVY